MNSSRVKHLRHVNPGGFALLILGLVSLAAGCGLTNDGVGCGPPPALAASDALLANSCPAEVSYKGRTYSISGGTFHKSWIGKKVAEQGETSYGAAYALRSFPTDEVIVLGSPPDAPKEGVSLGITEDFDETDFERIQAPFSLEATDVDARVP
ncbi:MAG: hypothetical protein H0U53_10375 [Actinobacteria bacterium]|nr:hypothetical protein [Actinomycetota bacterium]